MQYINYSRNAVYYTPCFICNWEPTFWLPSPVPWTPFNPIQPPNPPPPHNPSNEVARESSLLSLLFFGKCSGDLTILLTILYQLLLQNEKSRFEEINFPYVLWVLILCFSHNVFKWVPCLFFIHYVSKHLQSPKPDTVLGSEEQHWTHNSQQPRVFYQVGREVNKSVCKIYNNIRLWREINKAYGRQAVTALSKPKVYTVL